MFNILIHSITITLMGHKFNAQNDCLFKTNLYYFFVVQISRVTKCMFGITVSMTRSR